MYFVVIFIVLIVLAYLSHYANRYRRNAVKNLKGPSYVSAIDSLYLFLTVNPKNFIAKFTNEMALYNKFARYLIFNRVLIVSSDFELNEQLLAKSEHIDKHPFYKIFDQWLGNGVFLSEGKKWRQRRKIITPAFHFNVLKEFIDIFDQQSTILIQRFSRLADGKTPFNVYHYVSQAALDIITETAMGTKVHAQSAKSSEYANAVDELTALLAWRLSTVYLHIECIFTLLYPLHKLRQMKLIQLMHDFTIKVIEKRRSALLSTQLQNQSEPNFDSDLGQKKRMVLLDVLLHATIDGKPLTNEDIREEVDTFMFGGHDTVTSAISYALYLLARHEKVQQKLRAEVLHVLGETNVEKAITMHNLAELKYTECVIKETLRMYPSAPIIGRKIVKDFEYTHSKYGKSIIPAGTEFGILIIGQNYDPEHFKEPESFIPERHEHGESASASTMISFSAGPRNCIGQKFAMLEIKTMLAKIVREFYLLPLGESIKPEMNIVLRSSNGFQLGLKKVNIDN